MIEPVSRVEKVCPVVLRDMPDGRHVLVFRHPLAGTQLVKGTVEPGEALKVAALRELAEESGLSGTVLDQPRWSAMDIAEGQIWHFLLISVSAIPERFRFHTADDGGHVFSFFWWPLHDEHDSEWHDIFIRALHQIRAHLN